MEFKQITDDGLFERFSAKTDLGAYMLTAEQLRQSTVSHHDRTFHGSFTPSHADMARVTVSGLALQQCARALLKGVDAYYSALLGAAMAETSCGATFAAKNAEASKPDDNPELPPAA